MEHNILNILNINILNLTHFVGIYAPSRLKTLPSRLIWLAVVKQAAFDSDHESALLL